jgi:hypothetical protein
MRRIGRGWAAAARATVLGATIGACVGWVLVLPAYAVGPADGTRLVTITDPRIVESSGLTTSPTDPDVVWTVNDSGDSARAFAVSLKTGRTVGLLKERTDARDCEAMTSGRDPRGRPMLWIGDIGDNNAVRTSVVLRLLHEPDPTKHTTLTPVNLRVRYPGGPSDAETLIWTPAGRLLIVTKQLFGGQVLEVPPAAVRTALAGDSVETPALARLVGRVSQGLPTDGVALPDGRLVIRDYEGATVYEPPAYDGKALVAQTRLSWPLQDQGETVAAIDDGRSLVVGSEGKDEDLLQVAVPAAPGSASGSRPSSTATSASPAPASGSGSLNGRLAGGALIGLAVVTIGGVARHLRRGRRRAAPPR